ncbi:GAF domain-containing protein [Actinoplanes teichomyceticus]|uniref:GAF domain-containing protein n=1 Tax=Actinoplanes teichomyceticus TaxID=1867 RepID=A0A561WJT2_ACTTI|nr:GAF domain-containing protein [Actinoplanes teichomyceticus]TWG24139.1 GAF domain-containing protein [Actinoplanes teichomyceticus]GIF13015.1 hypothetical protein Ate01nite_30470 [Actinoplanes teichomyceticus]
MSVAAFETCSLDVLVDTRAAAVTDLFLAGLLVRDRLQVLLDDVAEQLDAPIAGINLVREDAVLFAAATGAPAWLDPSGGMPAGWAPCRRVADLDTALLIGDLHAVSWGFFPPSALFGTVRAYAGVPLRTHGVVAGTLCVMSETPQAFRPATLDRLEQRAAEVMAVLDSVR